MADSWRAMVSSADPDRSSIESIWLSSEADPTEPSACATARSSSPEPVPASADISSKPEFIFRAAITWIKTIFPSSSTFESCPVSLSESSESTMRSRVSSTASSSRGLLEPSSFLSRDESARTFSWWSMAFIAATLTSSLSLPRAGMMQSEMTSGWSIFPKVRTICALVSSSDFP